LIAGDRVLLKSGGWLRVDAVADGGRVETVYNLEVEDDHTYFVGADEWGFAVWAHNADYSITWDKATGEWVLKDEKGTERGRGTEKEPLQAQGKARAWETADETFIDGEFQVGKHGDMPTPRLGRESHHGVMSKWMAENFNDYNPKEAPAVLMSAEKHNATRGVFNKWAAKMEERMGGPIDWTQVSEKQMRSLSEDMFDAAGVPQ
jgi:hypothetical protein